jgi:two-component system response regulator HydG
MSGQKPLVLLATSAADLEDVVRRAAAATGYDLVIVESVGDAVSLLHHKRATVVIVAPPGSGPVAAQAVRALRDVDPSCEVAVTGAAACGEAAVEVVLAGARDCLAGTPDADRVGRLLTTVLDDQSRRMALLSAEADLADQLAVAGLVGRSPVMQELVGLVRRVAPHARRALVTGEPGSGRSLVARALHALGAHGGGPCVTLTALADASATEAAWFGVDTGRTGPNGALARAGQVETAAGGTLVVEDLAGVHMALQTRLLRIVESGVVHLTGGLAERRAEVRVFATAGPDVHAQAASGRLRHELVDRLAVVGIAVPPLRDRREDIPLLVAHFVRDAAGRLQRPIRGFTAAAEGLLMSAPWPGNVRELRLVVERACLLAENGIITDREVATSLPPPARLLATTSSVGVQPSYAPDDPYPLAAVEREHILRALQRAGGNKKAAARMLGVSRRALYRRLERLDLGSTIARRRSHGLDEHDALASA